MLRAYGLTGNTANKNNCDYMTVQLLQQNLQGPLLGSLLFVKCLFIVTTSNSEMFVRLWNVGLSI